MLIRDFLLNLRRRWYLVLVGVVATVALCAAAYVAVPANYETKASLLLLPPKSSVGTRGNPFLYLGGLNQALDVLSTRLNSAEILKPIAEENPGLSLEIARDATTSGPILVIDAVGTDGPATQRVVNGLVGQVPDTMQTLQDNLQIPTNSRITVLTLNIDPEPQVDLKNKLRAVIALAAVGVAGTVVLVGLIDSLLIRRRRRDGAVGADGELHKDTEQGSGEDLRDSHDSEDRRSSERELVGASVDRHAPPSSRPATADRHR